MNMETVHRRIDELSAIAYERMKQCDAMFSGTLGGAPICFLNKEEAQELHELKLKLPTSKELAFIARQSVFDRVLSRQIKTYRSQPSPTNRQRLQNYLDKNSQLKINQEFTEFLSVNEFKFGERNDANI